MMDQQKFILDLGNAQQELNKLLLAAGAQNLKCEVSVNNAHMVPIDDPQVVGLKVISTKSLYNSDGVP